jgi:hypothetical protein
MGLTYSPISLMMLRAAPAGREGWASASLNLADVLGDSVGIGIGGAAVATVSQWHRPVASGVVVAFGAAAVAALGALVVSRRLPGTLTPVDTADMHPGADTPASAPAHTPLTQ